MRIQARLFLGTSLMVLALMSVQWWIHHRQLREIERQLGAVAASVGEGLLNQTAHVLAPSSVLVPGYPRGMWVEKEPVPGKRFIDGSGTVEVDMVVISALPKWRADVLVDGVCVDGSETGSDVDDHGGTNGTLDDEHATRVTGAHTMVHTFQVTEENQEEFIGDGESRRVIRRLNLRVDEGENRTERYLVLSNELDSIERKIPIPVSPTVEVFRASFRSGLAIGVGLLAIGLVGSGVLASRVARPLRDLAERAEALGAGDLGVQVEENASGEVGELQGAFNRMSRRLVQLESERDLWRQREHLAQLGNLARGLAHTLRNPLNTLGLAVEELAEGESGSSRLVGTARGQIRRIDRWLRSFLAVSAGEAAEFETCDLHEIVESVAFEVIQGGVDLRYASPSDAVNVAVIPAAIRAAIANLVENAVQASPPDQAVEMVLDRTTDAARITVMDRGPGVPNEVREKLFSPHVTTKVEGAGMGLYLAQQLIVAMHDGRLELQDRSGGGTVVTVELQAAQQPENASEGCEDV